MMENKNIQQSPGLAKISNSSQQFRQLINELRKNQRINRVQTPKQPQKIQIIQIKEEKQQHENRLEIIVPKIQVKLLPKMNSLANLNLNQEEDGLKFIPKMQIGGRDALKKRRFQLDNNPQVITIRSQSKQMKREKDIELQPIQVNKIQRKVQPIKINASTQCQKQYPQFPVNYLNIQSNFSAISPQKANKAGQIIKQQIKAEILHQTDPRSLKKIKDINENIIIDYYQKQNRLHEKSQPNEIFSFFTNLCFSCDIYIKAPSIKKYKNCVYFGFPIQKQEIYEGFLYFYQQKFYYGQLLNGYKHGLGVEINFYQSVKYKGQFKEGHKNGKFYVEKKNQKYIGFLENGLYQGQGRLVTNDYTYQGMFDRGQKNGYGEQFYPKTGIKISGNFRNGILQKTKISKSIPQIRSKNKMGPSKDKVSSRLQQVRKRSLEKHAQRMLKLNKTSKSSQYQMQFDTQEQYNDKPKIQFNTAKLEMYRQPIQKLPRISQEYEYSFDSGRNLQSINTNYAHHMQGRSTKPKSRFQINYLNGPVERTNTNQFEQPLPSPCLSMIKKR